jgi:hypothetical protein
MYELAPNSEMGVLSASSIHNQYYTNKRQLMQASFCFLGKAVLLGANLATNLYLLYDKRQLKF